MLRVTVELITGPKGTEKKLLQYDISNVTPEHVRAWREYTVNRWDGASNGTIIVTGLITECDVQLEALLLEAIRVGQAASRNAGRKVAP